MSAVKFNDSGLHALFIPDAYAMLRQGEAKLFRKYSQRKSQDEA